ncbi:hypothetical protein E2C01_063731 [Portunus trituberculatus]|uniref:Uncharacterized protein n=1 Tax=Portunus trituberculatus TaxID=210409 RepID=A0A5B7HIY3_PORTR|nr:hypothetical protein [Portunus trituberculatus]
MTEMTCWQLMGRDGRERDSNAIGWVLRTTGQEQMEAGCRSRRMTIAGFMEGDSRVATKCKGTAIG